MANPLLTLSVQLDQMKIEVSSGMQEEQRKQFIRNKFEAWGVNFPQWAQYGGIIDEAHEVIVPSESFVEMTERIYQAISWEGLARAIGLAQPYSMNDALKNEVIKQLQSADRDIAKEYIDSRIEDKLKHLVQDFINVKYLKNRIVAEGALIIGNANLINLADVGECMNNIVSLCKDKIASYSFSYHQLIQLLQEKKMGVEKKALVERTWCDLLERALSDPYKQLIEALLQKLPDKNGNKHAAVAEIEKIHAKAWKSFDGCDLMQDLDVRKLLPSIQS